MILTSAAPMEKDLSGVFIFTPFFFCLVAEDVIGYDTLI